MPINVKIRIDFHAIPFLYTYVVIFNCVTLLNAFCNEYSIYFYRLLREQTTFLLSKLLKIFYRRKMIEKSYNLCMKDIDYFTCMSF